MSQYPMFAGSRIAPAYFALTNPRSHELRRGLSWAVVPMAGGDTSSVSAFMRSGRELVRGVNNTFNGGVIVGGNACGPALRTAAQAMQFTTSHLPTSAPLSVFGFLVNRGAAGGIQSFVSGKGSASNTGWTFQFSYGSGQLGLTRWGVADNPTVSLGAVPSGGAHNAIGLAHDGTTARFFLNGRFENVASGAINVTGNPENFAFWRNGGTAMNNADVYVIYVWSRVLLDTEFLYLMQDPWAIVRPAELPWSAAVAGGGGGSGARAFVAGIIG